MPIQHAIWKVGEKPEPLTAGQLASEQKLAATVDLNLAAVLGLELRHLLGKLALEQDGIVPVEPTQKVGAGTTANPAPAGQSRADPHVFDALQLAKVQWQETLDSIAPLAA